jgi:hypothetical protein
MERAELEGLDRDTLIGKAEDAGVSRARILTRPELIDELLLRTARAKDPKNLARARGFFGRARDLLARVVEKGLHLPDAAERIRSIVPPAPPPSRAAAALPTVTLAEIYATQGHKERAIETLRRVLEREPEHGAARQLLTQLEDEGYVPPPPPLPPEDDAPPPPESGESLVTARSAEVAPAVMVVPAAPVAAKAAPRATMKDDAPLPSKYDVDECVAIPVDPSTLFVYWEVRDATARHLATSRPGGVLVLRLVLLLPTWDGPRTQVRDHEVHASHGDYFVRGLPIGTVVRAAIGWRIGEAFVAIAQSPALETHPGAPSPSVAGVLVRWTPNGATRVTKADADAPQITKALDLARAKLGVGPSTGENDPPMGASERMLEV